MFSIEIKNNLIRLIQCLFFVHVVVLISACGRDDILTSGISNIKFKADIITLSVGKSEKLQVEHTPVEITPPDYTWSSSDPQIATVENGTVYSHKIGETQISVSVNGRNLIAKTLVKVVPILPTVLKLNVSKTTLLEGEEVQATYTIEPMEVSNPDELEIKWSSSDIDVCTVEHGKIKAASIGTAKVTGNIAGTAIKAELDIEVIALPIASIELSRTEAELVVGKELQLNAKVLPVNASDQTLIWSSNNLQVADVNDGLVQARKEGEAIISASSADGKIRATCKIMVKPVSVERISLSTQNMILTVGDKQQIGVSVFPEEAKDKSVIWTSSDNNVATVDFQGHITANAMGNVLIKVVSSVNPQIHTTCQLTVVDPESRVFTQLNSTNRVSENGCISADINTLFENGSSVPLYLISFEILSNSGELVTGDYLPRTISMGMQQRHRTSIIKVYRPFVRYTFELKGKRYERRLDIL